MKELPELSCVRAVKPHKIDHLGAQENARTRMESQTVVDSVNPLYTPLSGTSSYGQNKPCSAVQIQMEDVRQSGLRSKLSCSSGTEDCQGHRGPGTAHPSFKAPAIAETRDICRTRLSNTERVALHKERPLRDGQLLSPELLAELEKFTTVSRPSRFSVSAIISPHYSYKKDLRRR